MPGRALKRKTKRVERKKVRKVKRISPRGR